MKHCTLIPKDHPQAHLLDQLTHQVLDLINVSEAFISVDNDTPEIIFTFLIDTTYTRIDNEILLPLHRIFQNHPSITYRVFSCDYATDALRKANLYFLRHCTLGTMIYSNSSATHAVDLESELTSIVLPRTKKHFKRAMARIDGRYTDFPKCLKFEKLVDGACILHQMLEQLFKLAELFLLGKQVFSKDITEHQGELLVFAPSLAMLFNSEDEEEARLQKLLYSAYLAYRNKDRLGIDREDLQKLLFKTQWARQEVERLFKEGILHCYQKAQVEAETIRTEKWANVENILECKEEKEDENILENNSQETKEITTIESTNTLPVKTLTEETKMLTEIICSMVKPAAIYCFAKHNTSGSFSNSLYSTPIKNSTLNHYYLLVVSTEKRKNASNDIADKIRAITKGVCTTTILFHKLKDLKNKTTDQYWFFSNIITKGELLYSDGETSLTTSQMDRGESNTNRAQKYYNNRIRIANILQECPEDDGSFKGIDIKPVMLHQVVEQVCLGLIRLVLGYSPNHFALSYLFDLCSLFTTFTSDFFPQKTEEDIELYKLLTYPLWELRYSCRDDVDYVSIQVLERRCNEFIAYTDLFVRQRENSESEAIPQYKKN